MKVLLVGEYSGLFNCLKEGLVELGHEVYLASGGDGYRDYPSDYRYDYHLSGLLRHFNGPLTALDVNFHSRLFKGYDVVHVVGSHPLGNMRRVNVEFFKLLKKNNGKVFLSGAGLEYKGMRYWYNLKDSKYYNYVNALLEEKQQQGKQFVFLTRDDLLKEEEEIHSIIDGYIPIMYEYVPYMKESEKLKPTIPIPINLNKFTYHRNVLNEDGKLVFFHGISRPCKGGKYIIGAFDKLREPFKNEAVFMARGGVPFEEYVQILRNSNVVLDDANAYSLGMNSLFSMAQGRIVMGGAEEVANKELNYSFCPAFNLKADTEYIAEQIVGIIKNKEKIEELGFKSRKLVEDYHNYIRVAETYIQTWS